MYFAKAILLFQVKWYPFIFAPFYFPIVHFVCDQISLLSRGVVR